MSSHRGLGGKAELEEQTKLSDHSLRVRTWGRKVSVGNRKGSCSGGIRAASGRAPTGRVLGFSTRSPFCVPFLSPDCPKGTTHPEPVGLFALDPMGESQQCPLSRRETLRSRIPLLGTTDTSKPFPPRQSEPAGGTDARGWDSGTDLFVC